MTFKHKVKSTKSNHPEKFVLLQNDYPEKLVLLQNNYPEKRKKRVV